MTEPSQMISLYTEEGFVIFIVAHFVSKRHIVIPSQNLISSLLYLIQHSFSNFPSFMTLRENRNKDRFYLSCFLKIFHAFVSDADV